MLNHRKIVTFNTVLALFLMFSVVSIVINAQSNFVHFDMIHSIEISPDGSMIAVSRGSSDCSSKGFDHRIEILDADSLDLLLTFSTFLCLYELTWSHDNTFIATSGWDGAIRFFDIRSGNQMAQGYGIMISGTFDLSWRANNNHISGMFYEFGYFAIYDARTGLRRNIGIDGHIGSVQWHPTDANRVATSNTDGNVQIRTADGQQLSEFYISTNPITNIDWSSDASMLLLQSNTPTTGYSLFVIDVLTGSIQTQIDIPREEYGFLNGLEWSKDSQIIVTVNSNGNVNIWDATDGTLIDQIVDESQYIADIDIRTLGANQYQIFYAITDYDLRTTALNSYIFSYSLDE